VRTVRVLSSVVREGDAVARIGGDQPAVLAIGAGAAQLQQLRARAERAPMDADVHATLGCGLRGHDQSLEDAYRTADLSMLEVKQPKRERLQRGDTRVASDSAT